MVTNTVKYLNTQIVKSYILITCKISFSWPASKIPLSFLKFTSPGYVFMALSHTQVCLFTYLYSISIFYNSRGCTSFSYLLFPPHNYPVRWLRLREEDWPKVTQPVFMLKGELELKVSWFVCAQIRQDHFFIKQIYIAAQLTHR